MLRRQLSGIAREGAIPRGLWSENFPGLCSGGILTALAAVAHGKLERGRSPTDRRKCCVRSYTLCSRGGDKNAASTRRRVCHRPPALGDGARAERHEITATIANSVGAVPGSTGRLADACNCACRECLGPLCSEAQDAWSRVGLDSVAVWGEAFCCGTS